MSRKQVNFEGDQDVYQWLQSIKPGFRRSALNQACREAAAKGNNWICNLALNTNEAYQAQGKLGNDRGI